MVWWKNTFIWMKFYIHFTFIFSSFLFQYTWNLTMDKHWPFMLPPQGSIGQLHTPDPVHLPQRGCQLDCQWYTSYPLFLLCDPCDPCSLMHKDCANTSAGQMSVLVQTSKTGMISVTNRIETRHEQMISAGWGTGAPSPPTTTTGDTWKQPGSCLDRVTVWGVYCR